MRIALSAAAAAALVVACSPAPPTPSPVSVSHPEATLAPAQAPAGTVKARDPFAALAKALPAGADLYVQLDLREITAELEALQGTDAAAKARSRAMKADLRQTFARLLGPDPSGVEVAVGFVDLDTKVFGVVSAGDFGKTKLLAPTHRINGIAALEMEDDLLLAKVGAHLAVANAGGLEVLANVRRNRRPALAGSVTLKDHRATLAALALPGAPLIATANVGAIPELLAEGPLAGAQLTYAAAGIHLDGSLATVVAGDQPSLARVGALIDAGLASARSEAQKSLAKGHQSENLVEALALVMGGHSTLSAVEQLKITKPPGHLRASYESAPGTGGAALFAAVAAVGAVVAIPAFIKYQRRAKTTEAIDEIDKIYKGAAVYYMTPHVNRRGQRLPCQFPAGAPPTPARNCCQALGGPDRDGDGRCDADPNAWSADGWSAVNYQLSDQHYFVYSYDASGTDSTAGLTITANADLDCDGVMSTFQRMAFGDPQSNGVECNLTGSPAFYVEKETE